MYLLCRLWLFAGWQKWFHSLSLHWYLLFPLFDILSTKQVSSAYINVRTKWYVNYFCETFSIKNKYLIWYWTKKGTTLLICHYLFGLSWRSWAQIWKSQVPRSHGNSARAAQSFSKKFIFWCLTLASLMNGL